MMNERSPGNFLSFPDKEEIVGQLHTMDAYGQEYDPLFRMIAERLALKAYDRSAFVFILIELVYEFEVSGDLSDLLLRTILVLTEDPELAESGLSAYAEIKATLEPTPKEPQEPTEPPEAEEPKEPEVAEPEPEIDDEFLDDAFPAFTDPLAPYVSQSKTPHLERLMLDLQEAQKQVADLGLSSRMAIDMTLGRVNRDTAGNDKANRDGVSHTLREISALRAALRSFEELLCQSEELILEEIGVLDKD